MFIESKKSFARHLKAEVDAYPTLHGATVDVIHGTYEEHFPRVVEYLATTYRQPVPTFAFVDPRGYADNPFSHIEDFKRRMPDEERGDGLPPGGVHGAVRRDRHHGRGSDEALRRAYVGGGRGDGRAVAPARRREARRRCSATV